MTTPGELDRIVRSLVRTIEERDDLIKKLKIIIADYRDKEARRNLGFPPRNLTPSYATYQDKS